MVLRALCHTAERLQLRAIGSGHVRPSWPGINIAHTVVKGKSTGTGTMDAVNAFNQELFCLMDMKPPISRAKMIAITKSAIKAIKLYKHVVQIVEKFIKKCKPEYKVPGLYVVDSIVRQSRHQFGQDKDVFGPRFIKNLTGTFQNLYLCPTEDKSKIVRVLNLWQKNGVFKIEIIQPLLDMAAGTSTSAAVPELDNDTSIPGSPPSPVKVPTEPPLVTTNSAPIVPQLPNSDAFAAVAQLFQSTQGQQLQQILQTFQQPPKPQSPAPDNKVLTQVQAITAQLKAPVSQTSEQKAAFDKKLLDRFDYDDEPEGGEDAKKDDSTPFPASQSFGFPEGMQHPVYQQLSGQMPNMEHFQQHMLGMPQEPPHHQGPLPPNGQLQGYSLMPAASYPPMVQQMTQSILPPPTSQVPHGYPPGYPTQNEPYPQQMVQQQDVSMEIDPPLMKEVKHRTENRMSRSKSASRSPKRRRSRSNSRSRRSRHRRSRSRSRDRRRHSPRSRSQERREREKDRERRQKGLPQLKADTLSVCSTTLWVGQLDKRTQQQDVANLLEEFGQIESINMIPPRGCAYIVMVHREDAYRALHKLSRGSFKVNQKAIKIAWALNKGIKPEYKQYWDVDLGVTYIPWAKVKTEDLASFCEGGILDNETLCPEWKNHSNDSEKTDEVSQNGGSEATQVGDAPIAAPIQVPGVQPMQAVGALQPPSFPGHMGIPPPGFPPGVPPPPPFMRPGFNPLQMPPGFLPPGAMPPMGSGAPLLPNPVTNIQTSASLRSSTANPKNDSSGGNAISTVLTGPRNNAESAEGAKHYSSLPGQSPGMNPGLTSPSLPVSLPQPMGALGNQTGVPGGPVMGLHPPSGGLLGARPGMIPLQRPPGVPPPHLQRFSLLPPRPNMPMPPQLMHRGPPPGPGGFGMLPPPGLRGPFSPHGPFVRPGGPGGPGGAGGPRGPEGPEDRDGRQFRNDRQGFPPGRERDQERFGRRPFGGGGRGEPEGRDRYSNRHDDYERPGGGRDRRDWGRSMEPDRNRDLEDRNRRSSGHRERDRDRDRNSRDGESRRDKDDNRGREKPEMADSESTDKYRDSNNTEEATDSIKELTIPDSESKVSEVAAEPAMESVNESAAEPMAEPTSSTEQPEKPDKAQS
ncbi:SR-related and CTD-associated factor 4-like isoform X2 [Acipenser ruthenus]|uniref:SR-related and CTD-associated factor 4-like isoform X2 n=1 Tax=Acipenser ruthenus TaxID=7906 RepID=UPI00274031E1|nr:SR-related and CTD-associated factor 4-like isoform X2 [Acipenser ruthenus]